MKITVHKGYKKNRGMVLIIALVVVLILSVIGMAAIRGSGLQELMAGNMRDQNVAFMGAETGLRQGEAELVNGEPPFLNKDGFYVDLSGPDSVYTSAPVDWTLAQWKDRGKTKTASYFDTTKYLPIPIYIVEKLDFQLDAIDTGGCADIECLPHQETKTYYRVTSRASGLTDSSAVILQSTYIR